MPDEIKVPVTNETTMPAEIPHVEPTNERESAAFKGLIKQINDKNSEIEKIKKEIADKERIATENEAKARGDWEKIANTAKAELEAAKAEARSARIESLVAGIADEDAREGVIRKMEKLPVDSDYKKFVDEYRAKRPELWQSTSFPAPATPPQGAGISQDSNTNWSKVDAMLNGGLPQQVADATNIVAAYAAKNGGKLPPGVSFRK
jgi:hypothetical protein